MTVQLPRSKIGYFLIVGALLLAVVGFYCAWQAGYYYDPKSDSGDMEASTPWSIGAFTAVLVSWLFISSAVPLLAGPTILRVVGSLFFFGVLLLPLGILMLGAAGTAGGQASGP